MGATGEHNVLAGLFGNRSRFIVFAVTLVLVEMFILILDDLGGNVSRVVLLAGSLGKSRRADHRHRGARPVVNQVWGGRNAGSAIVDAVVAVGLAHFTTFITRLLGWCGMPFFLDRAFLILGILSKVQALDGSGTLLADVTNNSSNGIGLVPQITIADIRRAHLRQTAL